MGRLATMSPLMSPNALDWSGVSSYRKAASNSFCQSPSGANAMPGMTSRAAWISSNSAARPMVASATASLRRVHDLPVSFESVGLRSRPPTYLLTRSI